MDILLESAVRVTALACGVAVLLRILHIHSPRLVHDVWTAVVVAMLLLPVVVAWRLEFALPVLPSHVSTGTVAPGVDDVAVKLGTASVASAFGTNGTSGFVTWRAATVVVYFAGAALMLIRLGIGLRRALAIRRSAVQDAGRLTHPACVTPMTIGVFAPVVVLPPDWASWDESDLSAVLAHEEEHVRRRDPLVVVIAMINRAIFWFHPLAWWLPRTIAQLSEQACDAMVISRGHDSDVYAACLLRFARQATDAGGRIAPLATAMPGAGLRERLGLLARPERARPSRLRVACAAAACAALVVVCAAARPTAAPVQNAPIPTSGQVAWSVYSTYHFEVLHNGLPADRVSEAASDAEAAYVQLSAALKFDMPRPVRIILVPRDRDLSAANAQAAAAPFAQEGRTRLVISLESLAQRPDLIVHELTHEFALEIVPETSRLEPVLIEGLAEYERGAWAATDLRMVRDAVAAGAIPPVASLTSTDRHWAHAVFDFVAAEHGAEGVRRLLFALRSHETLAQAVPMAFGVTIDQFDQGFERYVTMTFGRL